IGSSRENETTTFRSEFRSNAKRPQRSSEEADAGWLAGSPPCWRARTGTHTHKHSVGVVRLVASNPIPIRLFCACRWRDINNPVSSFSFLDCPSLSSQTRDPPVLCERVLPPPWAEEVVWLASAASSCQPPRQKLPWLAAASSRPLLAASPAQPELHKNRRGARSQPCVSFAPTSVPAPST
ncbi:UNVERIFIED_CONTAM: hypothetical protein K2H54_029442, partial [Gekko kuhli]